MVGISFEYAGLYFGLLVSTTLSRETLELHRILNYHKVTNLFLYILIQFRTSAVEINSFHIHIISAKEANTPN